MRYRLSLCQECGIPQNFPYQKRGIPQNPPLKYIWAGGGPGPIEGPLSNKLQKNRKNINIKRNLFGCMQENKINSENDYF